jgi:hypothetical protein
MLPCSPHPEVTMPELVPISEETWALLGLPSTATLATVLAKHGLWKTFVTGARPLNPSLRMAGQAFTLRYIPSREDLDRNLVFDNLTDPQRLAVEREHLPGPEAIGFRRSPQTCTCDW